MLEKEKVNLWEGHVCCLPEICSESTAHTVRVFFPLLTLHFLGTGRCKVQ